MADQVLLLPLLLLLFLVNAIFPSVLCLTEYFHLQSYFEYLNQLKHSAFFRKNLMKLDPCCIKQTLFKHAV